MSNMSSKYKYIARNSIALFIGSFASKILVFFLLPLYTSYLTTSEYAVADLINTTISLLLIVLTLSVSDAILRFAMDDKNDKTQILSIGLAISGIGCIIAAVLAICICLFPTFELYAENMLIALALYVCCSLEKIFSSFVKGLEKIKLISVVGVISTAIMLILNIVLLVFFRWGVKGYLLSYVVSHLVSCIIYFGAGRIYRYFCWQWINKQLLIQMLQYSFPLVLVQICWQLNSSAAKYVVRFLSDDATVGMLSAALKIPAILTLITTLFSQAWNLSAIKESETDDSKAFYGSMFEIYTSFIVLATGAIVLGAELLGSVLLQGEFFAAWRYVPLYMLAFAGNSISSFLGSFYLAKRKTGALLGEVAAGTVINLVLCGVLFRLIGLIGTGIAATVGYFTIALLRLRKCEQEKLFSYSKIKLLLSFACLALLCLCMTLDSGFRMYLIGIGVLLVIILINMRCILRIVNKIVKNFRISGERDSE